MNTSSERGKRLYELWLSAGHAYPPGNFPPGNYTRWERLDPAEQGRWTWLAKAVGEIEHRHHARVPNDVLRFAAPTPRPPKAFPTYEAWRRQEWASARRYFWQRSRPPAWSIDTSRTRYTQVARANAEQQVSGVPDPLATADPASDQALFL